MPAPSISQDRAWHALSVDAAIETLETTSHGLTSIEAAKRLEEFGPNVLAESRPAPGLVVFVRQFRSPLIAILLVAALITVALQEWIDAAVIAAILLLNAVIGFTQERKAEGAVRALMEMAAPQARVVRDDREIMVDGREVVPGDLVVLGSGVRVPADLRITSAHALMVDESLLTGESVAVTKQHSPVDEEASPGDRTSVAFAGTIVTSGRGRGVVFATGTKTELGGIAELIRAEPETETPLKRQLDQLARYIGIAVGVSAAAVFVLGLLAGNDASELFLAAVALAVAAIPEGLPIVLTVALAIGVHRMARRNAIVRRLPAVETLGSSTVIGSDKTGTLTQNKMSVRRLWAAGRSLDRERDWPDFDPFDVMGAPPGEVGPVGLTLLCGTLANEASVDERDGEVVEQGDPTEIALLLAANDSGLAPDLVRDEFESLAEVPFEPEHQFAASLRQWGDYEVLFVKGAPERVLEMCDARLTENGRAALDADEVHEAAQEMAQDGLRVLGMAVGLSPRGDRLDIDPQRPQNLLFAGLTGMMDPPRDGVPDAIRACRDAGVRVAMITGDHAVTASAIAAEIGIAPEGAAVITGAEVDKFDDDKLRDQVRDTDVYARISPEGKLRIVRALQQNGEVVAVTGDGVNDAPALKAAAVGVAMGKGGTDVTREAAEIVLADDNFVSIVNAIEEGRITFENVRRATFFLISTGAATIVALLVSVVAGWPLIMLPAQLLWLNLVTNGVQDVALAFERGERDILSRPPRRRGEGVVSRILWERTLLTGLVMAAGTLWMFNWELDRTDSITAAQTTALTTMVVFMAFQAGNARSDRRSVFRVSVRDNPFLTIATISALALHIAALHLKPFQVILRVEPIDPEAWPRIIAVAVTVLIVVEIDKAIRRRRAASSSASP